MIPISSDPGKKNHLLLICACLVMMCSSCEKVDELKKSTADRIDGTGIRQEIEQAYEKVKRTGVAVPDNAITWAKEDIQKIGDWDYRVVRLEETKPDEIESRLNEYGRSRWEVIWIDARPKGKTLYMKRPTRSYLKHFPLREVLKTIPAEQGE